MKLLRLIPWLPPGLLLILFGLGEAEELSGVNPWDSGQKGIPKNLTIETKTPIDCVQTGEMHLQYYCVYICNGYFWAKRHSYSNVVQLSHYHSKFMFGMMLGH